MLLQKELILPVTFLFLLSSCFDSALAAIPCVVQTDFADCAEYSFSKLNVVGFTASITYVDLDKDASPYLKVLGASEEPLVEETSDGILTISPAGCSAATEPTEAPIESSAIAAKMSMFTVATTLFSLSSSSVMTSMILMASIGCFVPSFVAAADTCMPTLELEIGAPPDSMMTSKFGETDHYLAATVDTVTWGYYDPNYVPQITIQSGDTITVEVITHHSGHDYAKMIRGDPAVEEIFYWEANQSLLDKPEPKLPGSGVHLVTGPIEVEGAMPGDIIQVDILELDPRPNPETGKTYGTNSQKFAGYQYRNGGLARDGTPYVRTGGTEAITVFEFVEDEGGNMLYGNPVYMYRFPNMTAPDGSERTFDNNPAVMIPHEFNFGYDLELLEADPIMYPPGFDDTVVTDEGGIKYLSPDPALLDWKVPLRPHLGTLAVMPNNTANYIDDAATGGANTIPPARFGGNIDDWRIGKGGTMFYVAEVPGAQILVGDTHAAQGDSELAGTAMETSMTTKLRITLHKKSEELPKKVATLDFPLLETADKFIVHGFAYDNYLDQLDDASTIFAEGASLDLAMADCFVKTRNWLMDVYDLLEEETIALMTTSVDFGITQVVDGNWGVHADIPKWVFEPDDGPAFDYSCTTSMGPRRRAARGRRRRGLAVEERRELLEQYGVKGIHPEEYADKLVGKVAESCKTCSSLSGLSRRLGQKLLDAKLDFAQKK